MFRKLEKINKRPMPFEFYTASELWTDEHIIRRYHKTKHEDGLPVDQDFSKVHPSD